MGICSEKSGLLQEAMKDSQFKRRFRALLSEQGNSFPAHVYYDVETHLFFEAAYFPLCCSSSSLVS